MGNYTKGITASIGSFATVALGFSHEFCGTWLPALAGFLTAVGVVAFPNAKTSDK